VRPGLLSLLLAAAPALAQGDAFERELEGGVRMFEQGNYDDAATYFARARLIAPRSWRGHAYHSMTLIQAASKSIGPARRKALLEEAARVAASLVKQAGIRFTDPLFLFIQGVIQSQRGDDVKAYQTLDRAIKAPAEAVKRYDEVNLKGNLEIAFAKASVTMAKRLVVTGNFPGADRMMARAAPLLPESHADRVGFEHLHATICEQLGRVDEAIRHFRRVRELAKDEDTQLMATATVAMILVQHERLDEAREELARLPEESRQNDVVEARCMLRYSVALRNPDGPAMDEALAFYRENLEKHPEKNSYLLVRQFTDLVLARVGPAQAEKERPLLLEAARLARRQTELRPECPSAYFALYRIYRLLKDEEKEIRYQNRHARVKREWDRKLQFDESGRPRCR